MKKEIKTNFLKKTIATMLLFVMVFQFIPNIAIGFTDLEKTKEENIRLEEHIKKEMEKAKEEEPTIVGELKEQRTLNEKQFIRTDGTKVVAIFPSNIHYEQNGEYLDVDNTLEVKVDTQETLRKSNEIQKIEEKDNIISSKRTEQQVTSSEELKTNVFDEERKETKIYTNKVGNTNIKFSNKTKGFNLGSIENNGDKITWGLLNSQASNIKINNSNLNENKIEGYRVEDLKVLIPQTTIEYEEVLKSINIEYSVEPEHIKENIILKDEEAISSELKFVYDTGSLEMKLLETNKIIVYDKTEKDVKFTIETPYMYDGNLEFSNDIDMKLERQEGKYIISLFPDQEWLKAENRVYPVTIDPSIITSRYYQDIQDTFIYSTQGSTPKGNAHIIRAGNGGNVPDRSLIKFNLPELNSGDQVVGAYLNIFSYPKTTEWTPPTRKIQLDVHKMTSDWNESTATWSNTYNNYSNKIEDFIMYQFDYNNQCKQYMFNITSIAKEWYTTGNNYGVMIKEHSEANNVGGNDAYFISADTNSAWYEGRPMVQIIYRNQKGIEDYLSYHIQNNGRAGTVYTNDYNGNLVLQHQDVNTPGERMPVGINHVFNNDDSSMEQGYGKGFRLNLSQTVSLHTIDGIEYVKYIDEDGTEHYFYKDGTTNIYKDEDGLGLTFTLTNNYFTLKDKGKNESKFEKIGNLSYWHLKQIKDTNGNTINIDFDTTNSINYNYYIIKRITDGAGDAINLSYTNGKLSTITDVQGRTINYIYNSNGNLVTIRYPDDKQSSYTYNTNNKLSSVKNIDNAKLEYEYYPEKTSRIKSIKEYSNSNKLGNAIYVNYNNSITTFTDDKGFSNNITFNDWGQAISISDFGKGELNLKEAYGKALNYGSEDGNKNKITLEGKLNKSVNNLLLNGSFEYNGEWIINNWDTNHGTGEYSTSDKYNGGRSLKFVSTSVNNVSVIAQQEAHVEKGKIYTLSVQAKNENMLNGSGGGTLLLYYIKSSGEVVNKLYEIDNELLGWNKHTLSIEYPNEANSPLYVVVSLMNNSGTIYFDEVQLEEGTIANDYNMIENSTFDYYGNNTKSWTTFNAVNGIDKVIAISSNNNAFKILGDASQSKYVRQNIIASGKAGDIYSISAWIYAGGTRCKLGGTVTDLTLNIVGNNNEEQWISLSLYPSNQWQFLQSEFIAKHDYKRIDVYFCFYNNVNEAYVTSLALHKDSCGNSYQYDSKGNLIKTQDLVNQNNTFNYNSDDNLIKYTNAKGGTFEYKYDTIYKQRLIKAISSTGINYNFEYNQFGEAINTKIKNSNDSKYIETKAEYIPNGNYLSKLIDQKGNETCYEYNTTHGTLKNVTDANNNVTNYTYDNLNRIQMSNINANGKIYQNNYTYINDRINTINHNGFNYSFVYDEYGNTKQVKVENQTLVTNNYAANNGNLTSVMYGNNSQIFYTYDRFNRIITQTKAQGTYKYEYDSKSNLAHTTTPEGVNTYYSYDLANRLKKIEDITNNYSIEYSYDKNNNINYKKQRFNNLTDEINYTYDNSNRITNINLNNTANIETSYDNLSRIVNERLKAGSKSYITQYTYVSLENNKTTTDISSVTNGTNSPIKYTYDAVGNIKTISEGNILKATYYYDELNELIREDNIDLNKTITYTYDIGGNLVEKVEYPYTTGTVGTALKTINYGYTNMNWKDQLTSYDDKAITYDAIGNPLTYNGNTYTWQNGRTLTKIKQGTKTFEYKYNDNGIRTEKIVEGTVTKYYLEGTKVIYEKTGNDKIYYSYDENDKIVGLNKNGIQYYYIKNLQEDIIGILDNSLQQIVSYKYDSWGNIISIKDLNGNEITNKNNIGIINPYRYRGYRYDAETGLYYIQSRYYNPEWGRFLNGDSYGGQIGELLSHNIYAYCLNNPINKADHNGKFALVIGGAVSGVIAKLGIATLLTYATVKVASLTETIVDRTSSKVKAKSEPVTTNSNQKVYTVYTLRNMNNVVEYVGRTARPIKLREQEHSKNPARANLNLKKEAENLTSIQARGLEQMLIDKYKTLNRSNPANNQINGISMYNPNRNKYLEAAAIFLDESETYVGP